MDGGTVLVGATAILYFATAFGYAIGNIPVTVYIIRSRKLPTFSGTEFSGGGFFDRKGINRVIAASLHLHVFSLAFLPVGFWLWNSMKLGGNVALALFAFVMALFVGSGAPYPPFAETIKIILVFIAWTSLK